MSDTVDIEAYAWQEDGRWRIGLRGPRELIDALATQLHPDYDLRMTSWGGQTESSTREMLFRQVERVAP